MPYTKGTPKTYSIPIPTSFRGGPDEVCAEIACCQNNFNAILSCGRRLATDSFMAKYSTEFRIEPLEDLIGYLNSTLEIVGLDCTKAASRSTLAARLAMLPDVSNLRFTTLCPMTMLLRIIGRSLSELQVTVGPNMWGNVGPLHRQLMQLQPQLGQLPRKEDFHGGIARCILLHEEYSNISVFSTAPAYDCLSGLERLGKWLRYQHLESLRNSASADMAKSISRRLDYSEIILKEYQRNVKSRTPGWESPFHQDQAVEISGSGATFDYRGRYKLACAIDFCRFSMDRYDAGNRKEAEAKLENRGGVATESCAEWELWLVKLVQGPVPPPQPARYIPKHSGMPHPGTWPVPSQRPQKSSHRPQVRIQEVSHVPITAPPDAYDPRRVGKAQSWDHPNHPYVSQPPRPYEKKPKSRGCFGCC